MYDESHQDEQGLRAQLGRSRERLDELARRLETIDSELEDLSVERQQFELLGAACGALEKLSAQGVSELFWGDLAPNGSGDAHVLRVRELIAGFDKRVDATEGRRLALLEEIASEQDQADLFADDLLEIRRREEERKHEWVPERESAQLPYREAVMPWARGGEDDQRFRKSLGVALLLSLLLGLVLPLIDLPLPNPWETPEVPERLTSLIREQKPLPPKPVPLRPESTETRPEEQNEVAEAAPSQEAAPEPEARGILAFREKFSSLAAGLPDEKLGARARIANSGETGASRTQRSLVATRASSSSGGIDVSSISRNVGGGSGGGIEGVQIARATSSIGGTGVVDRPLSDGPGPARSDEEIQIVFDRHKAALYRLYNRELRKNPTLQGQMVLRLTIEPDGSVSLCEVKSTDMDAPRLSAQVAERVKRFDFGAKEGVPPVTILYPIDFLPAG